MGIRIPPQSLKELSLHCVCWYPQIIEESQYIEIIKQNTKIERLKLISVTSPTVELFHTINAYLPELKKMEFNSFANHCEQLTHVHFEHLTEFGINAALLKLHLFTFNNLKHLYLHDYVYDINRSLNSLETFLDIHKHVKSIKIHWGHYSRLTKLLQHSYFLSEVEELNFETDCEPEGQFLKREIRLVFETVLKFVKASRSLRKLTIKFYSWPFRTLSSSLFLSSLFLPHDVEFRKSGMRWVEYSDVVFKTERNNNSSPMSCTFRKIFGQKRIWDEHSYSYKSKGDAMFSASADEESQYVVV